MCCVKTQWQMVNLNLHIENLFLIDSVGEITMADFQLALCHIVPSMYRGLEGMVEWNPVSWEDIGGLRDVKKALKQVGKDTLQGCAFCTLSN